MDLVVDLNFRMDTSALYSDIILPSASWYEKNDLNTTDLHSYFHPLGAAVPPCWESRSDWDIFRALAEKTSELARTHFPEPFRDLVATPLLHDTPDEIAQPEVRDWAKGECEPIPGKTMPHFSIVERDYVNLVHRFNSLGPGIKEHGVEDHGVEMDVADLYDEFAKLVPSYEWGGRQYPSLVDAVACRERGAFLRARVERRDRLPWVQGPGAPCRTAAGGSGGEISRRPLRLLRSMPGSLAAF